MRPFRRLALETCWTWVLSSGKLGLLLPAGSAASWCLSLCWAESKGGFQQSDQVTHKVVSPSRVFKESWLWLESIRHRKVGTLLGCRLSEGGSYGFTNRCWCSLYYPSLCIAKNLEQEQKKKRNASIEGLPSGISGHLSFTLLVGGSYWATPLLIERLPSFLSLIGFVVVRLSGMPSGPSPLWPQPPAFCTEFLQRGP